MHPSFVPRTYIQNENAQKKADTYIASCKVVITKSEKAKVKDDKLGKGFFKSGSLKRGGLFQEKTKGRNSTQEQTKSRPIAERKSADRKTTEERNSVSSSMNDEKKSRRSKKPQEHEDSFPWGICAGAVGLIALGGYFLYRSNRK